MRVDQQNHRIGFRNVHRVTVGGARSIGGRFSSFLIFLIPTPSHIAEIRNVEGRYVFRTLKKEWFPSVNGPIEDCLGKEIPFVSAKGQVFSLTFKEWVSPLEEINRILRQSRSSEA
jgi:hypothetical protein